MFCPMEWYLPRISTAVDSKLHVLRRPDDVELGSGLGLAKLPPSAAALCCLISMIAGC